MEHDPELLRLLAKLREETARERELLGPARAAARALRLRRTLWRTLLRLARTRSGLGDKPDSPEQGPERS